MGLILWKYFILVQSPVCVDQDNCDEFQKNTWGKKIYKIFTIQISKEKEKCKKAHVDNFFL